MKNIGIKIIKRINIGVVEKVNSPKDVKKIECRIRINQVNAVKDWVSERNENIRIEKLFSDNNIQNWKISTSNQAVRTI